MESSREKKKFDVVLPDETPITFQEFNSKYKWPTKGSLRKFFFERDKNGLEKAFIKFRKRILVLPETLFRLIRYYGQK